MQSWQGRHGWHGTQGWQGTHGEAQGTAWACAAQGVQGVAHGVAQGTACAAHGVQGVAQGVQGVAHGVAQGTAAWLAPWAHCTQSTTMQGQHKATQGLQQSPCAC